MLILTSPAKTLDFDTPWEVIKSSEPQFQQEAAQLVKQLQTNSKKELATVLNVSDTLADINYQRYKDWKKKPAKKRTKPAILAYKGDVYQQLQANLYTQEQQEYAQQSLRILSGLYGVLRPYDLIQPYRLEMKTKISDKKEKLSDFWQERVTKSLQQEAKKQEESLVINCASNEYTAAVDVQLMAKENIPFYDIEFRQKKGKEVKNIGLYAKKARGMMIEHLIRTRATTLDQVKQFSSDGYNFLKQSKKSLVFVKQLD